jgi:quinol-cytochrome oxidoreductase complex cytochrome b subunit/cytochrome c551/c552
MNNPLTTQLLAGTTPTKKAWLRSIGATIFILILIECTTGALLSTQYTPATNAAYNTIQTLEAALPGRILRAVHHWASAALITLFAVTILRMLLDGEYKGQHQTPWYIAIAGLHLTLFAQLTGHALPWDTNAAATILVEAGIAANTWLLGPAIQKLILAGPNIGQHTLNLWHGAHIGLIPLAMLLLLGIPALNHRLKAQHNNPADPQTEPYYPNHIAKSLTLTLLLLLTFAILPALIPTPLEKEATAANLNGYTAKAEWYVAALHTLTLIPPFNTATYEPIVTLILPGITITALLLLPILHKNTTTTPKPLKAAALTGTAAFLALTAYSLWFEHPQTNTTQQTAAPPPQQTPAKNIDTKLAQQGKTLYTKNACDACHKIAGKGGAGGPDLTKAGELHPDRTWQIQHLKKPAEKVPGSTMPPYAHLPENQLKALAEYMLSLR